jgi:hypothetical protein
MYSRQHDDVELSRQHAAALKCEETFKLGFPTGLERARESEKEREREIEQENCSPTTCHV